MNASPTKSPGGAPPLSGTIEQTAPEDGRTVLLRGNRFDSRDIFQSTREIIIAHGEETYRLRLTAQNKLILTK